MIGTHTVRWRRSRRRRGASATELAIILPLFITIVLGCVDFGRFAYTYIAVTNAARAAAAYEMMNPPGSNTSPTTTWQNAVKQVAINEMSQQPGFQQNNLSVTLTDSGGNYVETESTYGTWRFTVTASYPFNTLVNWHVAGYGIPNSMTLARSVTMRGIRP
jgi:Flp pilus assembly protein TadG